MQLSGRRAVNILTLTKENFDKTVAENELIVVDFWADWCIPCRNFAPIFAKVAEKYPDITFGKINTEEQSQLAADFNIRSIPTLMVIRQKIMVFFEAGVLPMSALDDLIQQAKGLDMEQVKKQLGEGKI